MAQVKTEKVKYSPAIGNRLLYAGKWGPNEDKIESVMNDYLGRGFRFHSRSEYTAASSWKDCYTMLTFEKYD